jgi:hypothetical protein
MSLDMNKLAVALENEVNTEIMDLDLNQIASVKNDVLQQFHLPKEELKILHKKLKSYRYVDNLGSINYGNYVRWIRLKTINTEPIKLTNGGIVCDIKINAQTNKTYILCKNNMNRLFNLSLEENVIFQKLTPQEEVILSAINYLNK